MAVLQRAAQSRVMERTAGFTRRGQVVDPQRPNLGCRSDEGKLSIPHPVVDPWLSICGCRSPAGLSFRPFLGARRGKNKARCVCTSQPVARRNGRGRGYTSATERGPARGQQLAVACKSGSPVHHRRHRQVQRQRPEPTREEHCPPIVTPHRLTTVSKVQSP